MFGNYLLVFFSSRESKLKEFKAETQIGVKIYERASECLISRKAFLSLRSLPSQNFSLVFEFKQIETTQL